MSYFTELYCTLPRAGPGDDTSTRRAYAAMTDLPGTPCILDLGCGPGMQTLELLRQSGGPVVAVDNLPIMLHRLGMSAAAAGLAGPLTTIQADMRRLPFQAASFDIVWSEGALYIVGFDTGLESVKPLLRPGGYVAATEVVWLKPNPPDEVEQFWTAYPGIAPVETKVKTLESAGFTPITHFTLPASSWYDHYYTPLAAKVEQYAEAWTGIAEAEAVLNEARRELEMFERFGAYYGYAFFVGRASRE